jgi:hypothetical protein
LPANVYRHVAYPDVIVSTVSFVSRLSTSCC